MDDGSDFTFSQAGTPVSGDGFDPPDIVNLEEGISATLLEGINGMVVEDISGISIIKDELLNGSGSKQNGGFLWKGPPLPKNAGLRKEETVGSLSFNVIEASRPLKESARPSASEGGSSFAEVPPEWKKAVRKPVPRAKVPFEKGYSQMDWLKLTRTHPDLAGLKGQSNRRLVSMNEVKQHQTEEAMWTVLKGRVYNLSQYMKFHPGGVDMLMKAVGKDCTTLFNKYHAWVNAEFLLEKCLVGILDDSH